MVQRIDKRINNTLILSLGGNVGDVRTVFEVAINKIELELGEVLKQSSKYKTAAWGVENQPDFLNQVLLVKTKLNPEECLQKILALEVTLGRVRTGKKWTERIIDIDILFFNQKIIDLPTLKIPHPFIQERNFILFPLAEIAADFIHPQLNKAISTLKNECEDKLEIIKES
jgi:2-amino-4-hydroxy-6-hydroxymethyldihydropteridine diphosphokinase